MYRIVLTLIILLPLWITPVRAQPNCDPDYLADVLQLENMDGSPFGEAAAVLGDDPTINELSIAYRNLSAFRIEIEEAWPNIVDCSDSHRDLVMNYLHLISTVEDLLVLNMMQISGVISEDVYAERARPIADRFSEKLDAVMQYVTVED